MRIFGLLFYVLLTTADFSPGCTTSIHMLIMICMRHDDDNKSSLLWPLLDYDNCDPVTTTIIVTSSSMSAQTSIPYRHLGLTSMLLNANTWSLLRRTIVSSALQSTESLPFIVTMFPFCLWLLFPSIPLCYPLPLFLL